MNRLFVISVIFVGLFFGCKKYEDGPLISFRSAKHRLYGDYTLTRYTVNGIDSLQQMENGFGLNFHFYYVEDNDHDDILIDGGSHTGTYYQDFVSYYNFNNHKKSIRINSGSIMFTGYGVPDIQDLDFDISKLTIDEIHMTTTYNGKEYLLELKE